MDKKYYIHLAEVETTFKGLTENELGWLINLCDLYNIEYKVSSELSEKDIKKIME